MTANTWISLSLKQKKNGNTKSFSKFKVYALKFVNNTILGLRVFSTWTSHGIGGSGIDLHVNFDGSSTSQALGEDGEVILYPQAIFKDPFRDGKNILIIIHETKLLFVYMPYAIHTHWLHEPIPTNKHAEIFSNPKISSEVYEQENTLLQTNVQWPLGWPVGGSKIPVIWPRHIDAHYKACLYAGINISGTNGEAMPSQVISGLHLAKYQAGPSVGIEAGDHIWCSRYLLERCIEQLGVVLTLAPKPIEGDWNGAGCHTNCSLLCNTKSMGEEGGFEVIKKAILNLSLHRKAHIGTSYGERNGRIANRGWSFRVGRNTKRQGKGYLEDRRPVSNMKPYVLISLHAETTIL
ncbi:hypothetical protein ACJRO7_010347 [Eucalyptus globulus]|uniref:glutamine synthetase n=1 Tax=Eucalyptus globulus TaxID=34317 RepID=A0ABD3LFC2_EUCGL